MIIKDIRKSLIKFPQIQKENISEYPLTNNLLIKVFLEKILYKLRHNLMNTMLSEENKISSLGKGGRIHQI